MTDIKVSSNPQDAVTDRASAKAFRRITWFLVLCYLVSYLDRINIGFANLTMAQDLALTATMFGVANSIFYVAYASFEIPSNLALARFGAQVWISRIMITWGIASCLTLFATGPYSLYFFRFLVGASEAGLLPGVILYLSYWFRERDRARANGFFVMGMPLAAVIGAPMSGYILQLNGAGGLHGWQWLFLLEGVPSILLGLICYFYLVDRPAEARWLSAEEKSSLEVALAAERSRGGAVSERPFQWRELANWRIALLGAAYFCNIGNNNTTGTWTPLVVKEVLGNSNHLVLIGFISAVPPLLAVLALPLWSWSSDRKGERILHLTASLALSVVGWVVLALSHTPIPKLIGLALATAGGWTFVPVFWALAVPLLTPNSRPAAIAMISTLGLFASILSPSVIGLLRDLTHNFTAAFWYGAALNIAGIAALALAAGRRTRHEQAA